MFGGYKYSQPYFEGKRFVPPHDVAGIFFKDNPPGGDIERHLYWISFCGQMQFILKTFDRAAMWSGIETRAPFLDWRLFLLGLFWPKQKTKLVKQPLREMMSELPDYIRWWPKKRGFTAPKWTKHYHALPVLKERFIRKN
jgi:asparagine synthetase B (glutamine-hydrolysing)